MQPSIQSFNDDLFYVSNSDEFQESETSDEENSTLGHSGRNLRIDFSNELQGRPQSNKRKRQDEMLDYRDVVEEYKNEPCMLPIEQSKEDEKNRQYEEEGITHPNYQCELCRIGNLSSESKVSKGIDKVYEIYQEFYKRKNDHIVYEKMAEAWNSKVYAPNIRLDPSNELRIIRITSTIVQYHFENCSLRDVTNMIWEDIEFFRDAKRQLRKEQIYSVTRSGKVESSIPKVNTYLNLYKCTLTAVNFIQNLENRKNVTRPTRK